MIVLANTMKNARYYSNNLAIKNKSGTLLRCLLSPMWLRDRNIVEICDNVNTIPTQHTLAQSYVWATVYAIIYCSILVKHLFCEYILYMFTKCSSVTRVQMDIVIGEND